MGQGYAHPAPSDSVMWEKALQKMEEGKYREAISYYEQLDSLGRLEEREINSNQVEELSKIYSVADLTTELEEQRVTMMRGGIKWLAILILLCIALWGYMQWEQRRIKRYNRMVQEAIEMENSIMHNKSLLLANMSHEIKTPLAALTGFSELLTAEELDSETQQQCQEVIELNSELLLKLIHDVIDLSSLDSSGMKFNIQPTEIIKCCQRIIQMVAKVKTTAAEILFESDLSEVEIQTDLTRLQQVLINILMNATKFTAHGTITLKVEQKSKEELQFSVTDTGCGIPPEKQPHIFKKYEKLNEEIQGTGLGLSICELIIKRLGGRIWIDAEYRSGARFIFTHPL